jgi:type IV pilus assembly protein PilM
MGGGMYTSEIQKQLAVSFETAEELKVGKKDAGERADKITEIMRTVSNILSTEAQRSYNFFSATYPDRLVTKVYLTGGAAKSAFLKEGSLDPSLASDFNTAATVSVGLALRNQEDRR